MPNVSMIQARQPLASGLVEALGPQDQATALAAHVGQLGQALGGDQGASLGHRGGVATVELRAAGPLGRDGDEGDREQGPEGRSGQVHGGSGGSDGDGVLLSDPKAYPLSRPGT